MAVKFKNTLTRKIESIKPRRAHRLDIFVCGPTVYADSHIGHARTYTSFDGIVSYLRFRGYRVRYLVNITNIDDKIINRANETGVSALDLSRQLTEGYLEDMRRLQIGSPDWYEPASKHISEIVKQIARLIKKGYAYPSGGSVYYSVAKFKDYGKLSKQKGAKLRSAVRIEKDPHKKSPLDFVLWKAKKPGEPSWPSPWGAGRPGWHIEDTAISEHFFGPQYDIHGGGIELVFPHHESEIAQQEAASGKKPFVRMWLHTGLLNIRGEKMSKSLKNFITIRDMLSRHSVESFRLLVFRTHYRAPLHYSNELLDETERSLMRLQELEKRLRAVTQSKGKARFAKNIKNAFTKRLDHDFDTPRFLADLFTYASQINKAIDKNELTKKEAARILKTLADVNSVLKIFPRESVQRETIPAEIRALAEKREEFRKTQNWAEADRIRKEIEDAGFILEDSPSGLKIKNR